MQEVQLIVGIENYLPTKIVGPSVARIQLNRATQEIKLSVVQTSDCQKILRQSFVDQWWPRDLRNFFDDREEMPSLVAIAGGIDNSDDPEIIVNQLAKNSWEQFRRPGKSQQDFLDHMFWVPFCGQYVSVNQNREEINDPWWPLYLYVWGKRYPDAWRATAQIQIELACQKLEAILRRGEPRGHSDKEWFDFEQRTVSLSGPELRLAEFTASSSQESVEAVGSFVCFLQNRQKLIDAVYRLPASNDIELLKIRFALEGGKRATLEETASRLGWSKRGKPNREVARQKERRIIEELRLSLFREK